MSEKKLARERRIRKTRYTILRSKLRRPRLLVKRSNNHLYATIIDFDGKNSTVKTTVSTLEKGLIEDMKISKTEKAKVLGEVIAKRALALGILNVAFDRAGHKYHGCIKALANAARENGINF